MCLNGEEIYTATNIKLLKKFDQMNDDKEEVEYAEPQVKDKELNIVSVFSAMRKTPKVGALHHSSH